MSPLGWRQWTRRAAGEELAQQGRPLRATLRATLRHDRRRRSLAARCAGAQIIGGEFIEPSAAQAEFRRRGYPAKFGPAKGGKDSCFFGA